ncbi:Alpha/Beta hydrolase protein [Parasitella parasitica]|nr:Alpha/Beta hydrolase protein [Parasitella parasitica]
MSPADTSFLNHSSKVFLSYVPPDIDYSKLTIEDVRNSPKAPLSDDIPRPDVIVENIKIPLDTDGHPISVDVYRPRQARDAVLPALIYLPGGGWGVAAQGAHPYLAKKLAGEANCAVLLVNYSLSPEVRFPVALEECYTVVSHATTPDLAAKLKVDPTRVAVGGDSAGGNLTAAITILAKKRNNLVNSIKYQILYYPATNDNFATESYKKFGEGYYLSNSLIRLFYNNYKTEEDKDNILLCPGKATVKEVAGVPPALLVTGEADVLRDEGESYGVKLLQANVPVTSVRINGVIHGFMSIPMLHSEETLIVIDMTTKALRKIFAS